MSVEEISVCDSRCMKNAKLQGWNRTCFPIPTIFKQIAEQSPPGKLIANATPTTWAHKFPSKSTRCSGTNSDRDWHF